MNSNTGARNRGFAAKYMIPRIRRPASLRPAYDEHVVNPASARGQQVRTIKMALGVAVPVLAAGIWAVPARADMWCESGVVALGSHTTCSFASNVAAAYASQPLRNQPVGVVAYSPATGANYPMFCTGGGFVTCTGGDSAAVQIRMY